MNLLYLDLEWRSELDVTRYGTYAVAEHPSTEILCACWALDDGPIHTFQGSPTPGILERSNVFYVAHNIDAERNMLRAKLGLDIPLERWIDTAALAARQSLPRNLEELGEFFFPDNPERWKDMEGNRIMKKLARPRRPSADNPDPWWTPETKPEDFQKLYAYCARDVELMRDAHKKLLPLGEQEHRVWLATERANQRGVKIDLESIPLAQKLITATGVQLSQEFRRLMGCPARNPTAAATACGLPNMKKSTVRKALREDLDPRVRQALLLHRQLALSSTSKLSAMVRRVSADGRLRGALNYSGAERTGRWSSMGVQLQNFKRGIGELTDLAFAALHADVLVESFHGHERPAPDKPLETALDITAEILRGFLVGPFIAGDLAQIEARTLAWLAGQDDLVQVFRDKGDPYSMMASKIYGRPINKKKDPGERFMGKQVVLACGYGQGHRGFRRLLDETYDVHIDEPFAQKVIKVYRRSNPRIVKFWELLENAFRYVIANKSKRVKVARVDGAGVPLFMGTVEVAGVPYAFIELPSGRRLYYARPELKAGEIRYFGRDIRQGGIWTRISTYGGKLAENVTQAVSRDVIAESLLKLEEKGYELLFTVHDEIVAEDLGEDLEEFKRLMEEVPSWATGLPVEAECFKAARYRK